MSIRGSIDAISTQSALGWIAGLGAEEPLLVEARLQGRVIGEAIADRPRPDLAAAGLGDGNYGFDIVFCEALDPAVLPIVTVHPAGGDVMLQRTSLAGLHEFLGAVISRFPAAGRSRSIYGGLWVDRSDALRLLAGRILTGATPAELEAPLRGFIEDGFVKLPSAEGPAGLNEADTLPLDDLIAGSLDPSANLATRAMLEELPHHLFRQATVAALRALLDDNPVAVRAVLARGDEAGFAQPSAAEVLPSPAECVLAVIGAGAAGCTLDIVRGGHTLPEFTAAGESRWTAPGATAGIAIAVKHGASVSSIDVGPLEIALVSAGSLYRIRSKGDGAGVAVLCVPARQSAVRVLSRNGGRFQVRHPSGALLSI